MKPNRRSNFTIRPPERRFGIDPSVSCEIGDREKQVADLVGKGIAVVENGLDLLAFLADLGDDGARVVPIEADFAGLRLQFDGAGQGRDAGLDRRQEAARPPLPRSAERAWRAAFPRP